MLHTGLLVPLGHGLTGFDLDLQIFEGVSGPLLISPAPPSSALINVALGLGRFPMFQHLTGCNLIFPFHWRDGSARAQVKFVFDLTAGLLPGFTATEEKSQIPALLIIWRFMEQPQWV